MVMMYFCSQGIFLSRSLGQTLSEFDLTRHVRSDPIFHQKGNVKCQTIVFLGKLSSQIDNKSQIYSLSKSNGDSGLIDSITEPVLCASCKFNYSFAEESDRVNTFNCYLLQSFCNNNKQMMVQLPRQLNHQQHQDSDLPLDLTSIDSQSKDLLSE